ncbi:MFS transporter [Occultella glacieicola]|uniref:MFS transporter n=2 Tax=Occultella glacieicola TaxID=2518684 RepID=A0ABY2E329_9MICO|nr:MFS transporter [Occultella glacieicola]
MSDGGLSAAQISSLFVVWSLTAFVAEVPSGAWADTIDRRALLVLSGLLYALAFGMWLLWPAYPGYLIGFVCWGVSSALMSGTFEALLFDHLSTAGAAHRYAAVKGRAQTVAMLAMLAATASAGLLMTAGGFPMVGTVSVAMALLHTAVAAALPSSRAAAADPATAGGDADPADADGDADHASEQPPSGTAAFGEYLSMLRSGLREAAGVPRVRRVAILAAAMLGLTAYDEYFPLVLAEHGVAADRIPMLLAVIVAGQALGTALAGRTSRWSPRRIAWLYGVGAALVGVGAIVGAPAGFVAIALGIGAVNNAFLIGEARLQESISGAARATVTSVSGLGSEVFSLAVFALVALGSAWWSIVTVMALLAIPGVITAVVAARWLPPAQGPEIPPPARE